MDEAKRFQWDEHGMEEWSDGSGLAAFIPAADHERAVAEAVAEVRRDKDAMEARLHELADDQLKECLNGQTLAVRAEQLRHDQHVLDILTEAAARETAARATIRRDTLAEVRGWMRLKVPVASDREVVTFLCDRLDAALSARAETAPVGDTTKAVGGERPKWCVECTFAGTCTGDWTTQGCQDLLRVPSKPTPETPPPATEPPALVRCERWETCPSEKCDAKRPHKLSLKCYSPHCEHEDGDRRCLPVPQEPEPLPRQCDDCYLDGIEYPDGTKGCGYLPCGSEKCRRHAFRKPTNRDEPAPEPRKGLPHQNHPDTPLRVTTPAGYQTYCQWCKKFINDDDYAQPCPARQKPEGVNWAKVPKGTRVLVSDDGGQEWRERFLDRWCDSPEPSAPFYTAQYISADGTEFTGWGRYAECKLAPVSPALDAARIRREVWEEAIAVVDDLMAGRKHGSMRAALIAARDAAQGGGK